MPKENSPVSGSTTTIPCDTVAILFQEEMINMLFSELLEVRGVHTQIIASPMTIPLNARIITEVQYFSNLPSECRSQCLVVGNKDSLKGIDALTLSRPLTEEKIESALAAFLQR